MAYPIFPWIGNQIPLKDIIKMRDRKAVTGKPLTIQVAEAVSMYLNVPVVFHDDSTPIWEAKRIKNKRSRGKSQQKSQD